MSRLQIDSPLAGWALPLTEVPDPVFADGLAGDGIAIDPTGDRLHAPCDGRILLPREARHAVTVRSDCGVELLMHVGIETVALGGAGFELEVEAGQRVERGQPLLRFDLERIAREARSPLTPVLVVAGGRLLQAVRDGALSVGDRLMEIAVDAPAPAAVAATEAERRSFRIPFEHGLHARPAALLAASLRPHGAQVAMLAHGRRANVRSTVALMGLGVRRGDTVEVIASGSDATRALDALAGLLAPPVAAPRSRPEHSNQDSDPCSTPSSLPDHPAPAPIDDGGPPTILLAVPAAPGLAFGRAVQLAEPIPEPAANGRGFEHERQALQAALVAVQRHLEELAAAADREQRAVLEAHVELCQDPELQQQAEAAMQDGSSAAHAWRQAIDASCALLAGLADPHMRARAADLRDLQQQVLRVLAGKPAAVRRQLPEGAIVLADELLPSQLAALDAGRIAGICMARGGATSHVALLAMARGIPLLIGAGDAVLSIIDGSLVLLDAERGRLLIDPAPAERAAVADTLARRVARRTRERAVAHQPCASVDGIAIAVLANIGALAEVASAIVDGAEGCGLLRTEFLFLDRQTPPDEDEQAGQYTAIASAFGDRPLTIRTLDIGGDKPVPYLAPPHEENPALGMRGIRIEPLQPGLLRSQLRAILRVPDCARLRILLPMVNEPGELQAVRRLLEQCAGELGVAGLPQLGVMIETPSAALLARQLAADADFLSIGSNDLAQYTLAIDRQHPLLAPRLDAMHPAVLRLIGEVARAGRDAGRSVAVCGGLASDPLAVPLLLGLGVRQLSVVPALIPRIKQTVRELDIARCEALAAIALELPGAQAVREQVAAELALPAAAIPVEAR
jgi:multiphosphoryl transfer protein